MANSVLDIVQDKERSEFYPTPERLAQRMVQKINWRKVSTVLEPSAGKGDILRAIADVRVLSGHRLEPDIDVDCIEIDPQLREVLKYNFSKERKNEITIEMNNLKNKIHYIPEERRMSNLSEEDENRYNYLKNEENHFLVNGIHIVHDDFLTYEPMKEYSLLIMNPPFSVGARHLLKALDIQRNGGEIVCLLNAATLTNLYTTERQDLDRKLKQLGADIEFVRAPFHRAERKTDVDVAIVHVSIPYQQRKSDIFERMCKAAAIKEDEFSVCGQELEVSDFIQAIIVRYNIEAKAGLELIEQYYALAPHILNGFDSSSAGITPILTLNVAGNFESVSLKNQYLKAVRFKYWAALLSNPKFVGTLTSRLQREYRAKINALSDYEFTQFNIKTLSMEIAKETRKGIEDEIIALFDELTQEYSWYPECSNNRHYYNGWATNKAHKIGKKAILPISVWNSFSDAPSVHSAVSTLEDILRVMQFLDNGVVPELDLWHTIDEAFKNNVTKNIDLNYFKVTFYKKGTIHLTFSRPEIIDRLNIFAGKSRNWLPPCYGYKTYDEMSGEEKSVVDEFQGKNEYAKIMKDQSYYLGPVTGLPVMLMEENESLA